MSEAAQLIISTTIPYRSFAGHVTTVSAVVVFPDGRRMATSSHDKTIRLWDLKDGVVLKEMWRHDDWVRALAVSKDGQLIAGGDDDGKLVVWHGGTGEYLNTIKAHSDCISLDFSPDGTVLATGSKDRMTKLWSTKTWKVHGNPISCGSEVNCVRYSPSESGKLAIATLTHIEIWNPRTTKLIAKLKLSYTNSLAWTPDSAHLLSGGSYIREWDTSTWRQIGDRWTGHSYEITALAVNSTGTLVASASEDKHVRLWRRSDRTSIAIFKHSAILSWVAFSTDDKHIFSGGGDNKISEWAVPQDELLQDATKDQPPDDTLQESRAPHASEGDMALFLKDYDKAIELYSAAIDLNSASDTTFASRCAAKLGKLLWEDALLDAQKVIEINPSSYLGYELKNAALHGAQRYDEAIEAFENMLSMLNDTADMQTNTLRQQYISPYEASVIIRKVMETEMENIPIRLVNTLTGRLCNREAQIHAFETTMEYKEFLSVTIKHASCLKEDIQKVVATWMFFVMLSHRWEEGELLLHDIQDRSVYELDPVSSGIVKLQLFCTVVRDAGYLWAWSDTCCIDQINNVEVQRSVNSMFVWYRHSALTIVYLSDVLPSSGSGALGRSVWNQRGWTVLELLAPRVILFFQSDWTLYLNNRSPNHKESAAIMHELQDVTGIDAKAFIAFRPEMRGAREKLQWASMRVTTLPEDIAYSLIGIFGVHLNPIYGENKQNALGRLLQEIVATSGDITCLDWVGKPSDFNSCLPASIASFGAPPFVSRPLSEGDMQMSVSSLRDAVDAKLALRLYQRFESLHAPKFIHRRLRLPCIAFAVTSVRRRRSEDQESASTFAVEATGLRDMLITTEDKLLQRRSSQSFLLVRPWDRSLLELPNSGDLPDVSDTESEVWTLPDTPVDLSENDSGSYLRVLRLIVRLGQPFGGLLLAQQPGGEYKRIASDRNIVAQVKDVTAVRDMKDVRTVEIL